MRPLSNHYLHHCRLLRPALLPLPQLQVSQQSQQVGSSLRSPRLLRALPSSLPTETGNTTEVTIATFRRGDRTEEVSNNTIKISVTPTLTVRCHQVFIISVSCVNESNILQITQFRKLLCKKVSAIIFLDQHSKTVTLNTAPV